MMLLLSANLFAANIATGVSKTESVAGVASGDLLFVNKNAANLVNMPDYLLGIYSLGAARPGDGPDYDTPAGGLLGLRLGRFSIALHGNRSLDSGLIDLMGAGGGLAYSFSENISLGIYSGFFSVEGQRFIDGNLGMRYRLPFGHEFFTGFGIYNFNFALSALANPVNLNNLAVNYQSVPGLSLQFFRSRFLNMYLASSLALEEDLAEFEISSSVSLEFFRYLTVSGGMVGNDIFAYEHYFASSRLHIPVGDLSINLYAAYEEQGYTHNLPYAPAGLSGGFYVDYAPPLRRLKQEDSDVVVFFKPEKIFSPNGDGRDDSLSILLTHTSLSKVRDYSFAVLNEAGEIIAIKRANLVEIDRNGLYKFPNKFIWNGLDYKDQRVKKGNYSFKLVAVLKDGRQKIWKLGQITLDTEKPAFNVYVKNKNYLLGSEKPFVFFIEDKLKDTVYYNIKVVASNKEVIYEKKISSEQSSFSWFGKIREFTYVDSGTYNFVVAAKDNAGNIRYRTIENIQFYDDKDSISLNMKYDIFSPNGDGRRDELPIQLLSNQRENVISWQVRIVSADRRTEVRAFEGQTHIPDKIIWRGKDAKNKTVPNGVYHLMFSMIDRAGNAHHSLSYRVLLDSKPPELTVKSDQKNFTPDSDGVDDFYFAELKVENLTDIVAYKIRIRDKGKKVIFETSAKDDIPHRFAWDGVLTSGFAVDSFEAYSLEAEVMDAAGNIGKSNMLNFETGLLVRRMSDEVDLGEKFLMLRFPNIAFARRTFKLDAKSLERVKKLGIYLANNPQFHIEVIGHTDSRGSKKYNLKLSRQRANYVRSLLIKANIAPGRIKATGRGEEELLYKEVNEEYRTRNRRFEVKLTLFKSVKNKQK